MIVFIDGSGAIVDVTPSRFYQGEALGGTVYLVAPFSFRNSAALAFILPDGRVTPKEGMTPVNELEGVTDKLGDQYRIWSWATNNAQITAESGRVLAQFFIMLNGQTIATASTSFMVEAGADPLPPDPADPDAWEQILALINDNAARISRLEDEVTNKVLTDFTVNDQTGEGKKYYSDGTTATVQFPTGGGGSGGGTKIVNVLEFTKESFVNGELAFGPAQTGFTNNQYLAGIQRSGTAEYEAGTETTPSLRTGHWQTANTFFMGSDGSILVAGINVPFDGRLVLIGGDIVTKGGVVSVTKQGKNIVVAYSDGTTNEIGFGYSDLTGKLVEIGSAGQETPSADLVPGGLFYKQI